MRGTELRTNVYVDGFNLYYGSVKGTPYKWLSPMALAQRVLPWSFAINRIRYFTSYITPRPDDPDQLGRQLVFLRALRTIPNLAIHLGQFTTHTVTMRLANPGPDDPPSVPVIRTSEKGSDVNLASYLLFDAFKGDYDCALVVSNDSDLAEPIRLVTTELHFPVWVLNPQWRRNKASIVLRSIATHYRRVRRSMLAQCQFPEAMQDAKGTFRKPSTW